jgi:hypothetical protein
MGNPNAPSNTHDEVRDDAETNPDKSPGEEQERPAATQYAPEMGSVVITRHPPDEDEA